MNRSDFWVSCDTRRPKYTPSAYTAGEPKLVVGIAAIVAFIVVVGIARVFASPRVADPNAARHPLSAFNAALTGLH